LSQHTGTANAGAQKRDSSQTQPVHVLLNAEIGRKLHELSSSGIGPRGPGISRSGTCRNPVWNRSTGWLYTPGVPPRYETQMKLRQNLFQPGQMR
jgi:hypothetical protein